MSVEINRVNIGKEIQKRLNELNMTRTEFAQKINMRQQHIKSLLDKSSIDTEKLAKICEVLEFDFFALYSPRIPNINAHLAAVAVGNGKANYMAGDIALQTQLLILEEKVTWLTNNNQILENSIKDKEEIIKLWKDKMENT